MITVRPVPVATITISPVFTAMQVGQSVTLSAMTRDAAGNVLTGRVVGWSSSDQAVATVDNNGVVTGIAAGTVTISASSEGQTSAATVQVIPVVGPAMLAAGVLTLDDGAIRAVLKQRRSLLPAGITGVSGRFHGGDVVELRGTDAVTVARGVVAYEAGELATMIGRSTSDLPAEMRRPAVHADDLVAV